MYKVTLSCSFSMGKWSRPFNRCEAVLSLSSVYALNVGSSPPLTGNQKYLLNFSKAPCWQSHSWLETQLYPKSLQLHKSSFWAGLKQVWTTYGPAQNAIIPRIPHLLIPFWCIQGYHLRNSPYLHILASVACEKGVTRTATTYALYTTGSPVKVSLCKTFCKTLAARK